MGKSFLQHADFSSEPLEVKDASEAKKTLVSFNWAAEVQREVELANQKKETCPPGIGFWRGNSLFHVFIVDSLPSGKNFTVIATLAKTEKMFGIVPIIKKQTLQKEGLSVEEVQPLLELFYNDHFEQLKGRV